MGSGSLFWGPVSVFPSTVLTKQSCWWICPWEHICLLKGMVVVVHKCAHESLVVQTRLFSYHNGLSKILDKILWTAQGALSGQLRYLPLSFSHLRIVQGNPFWLSSRWSCLHLKDQNLMVRASHDQTENLHFLNSLATCVLFLKKSSDKMHSIFLYSSSIHQLWWHESLYLLFLALGSSWILPGSFLCLVCRWGC